MDNYFEKDLWIHYNDVENEIRKRCLSNLKFYCNRNSSNCLQRDFWLNENDVVVKDCVCFEITTVGADQINFDPIAIWISTLKLCEIEDINISLNLNSPDDNVFDEFLKLEVIYIPCRRKSIIRGNKPSG